jgi:hypothetical protein
MQDAWVLILFDILFRFEVLRMVNGGEILVQSVLSLSNVLSEILHFGEDLALELLSIVHSSCGSCRMIFPQITPTEEHMFS